MLPFRTVRSRSATGSAGKKHGKKEKVSAQRYQQSQGSTLLIKSMGANGHVLELPSDLFFSCLTLDYDPYATETTSLHEQLKLVEVGGSARTRRFRPLLATITEDPQPPAPRCAWVPYEPPSPPRRKSSLIRAMREALSRRLA